jgi:hypothetical protein
LFLLTPRPLLKKRKKELFVNWGEAERNAPNARAIRSPIHANRIKDCKIKKQRAEKKK